MWLWPRGSVWIPKAVIFISVVWIMKDWLFIGLAPQIHHEFNSVVHLIPSFLFLIALTVSPPHLTKFAGERGNV